MAKFAELLATAIANADSREALRRLVDEQAALRSVATLVARQAPQTEIFNRIAEECVRLFGTPAVELFRYDGDSTIVVASTGHFTATFPAGSRHQLRGENVSTRIRQTGNAARIDNYAAASGPIAEAAVAIGLRSALGHPIIVEDQPWGGLIIGDTAEEPLPPETEARLGEFTELMATAIANAEARAEVRRLAGEQAALRRVATLVAEGASPSAILDAVAAETERALGADGAVLLRYEPNEEVTVVAHLTSPQGLPTGARVSHKDGNVSSMVRRSGRPARIGDYTQARGPAHPRAE